MGKKRAVQERHLRGHQSGKEARLRVENPHLILPPRQPLRFNDLLRKGKPDDLNARTLSRTLKYLQNMGIVERRVTGTEPFSVVYSLTEKGRDLGDVLSGYRRWGEKWTPSIVHPLPYARTKPSLTARTDS
ncbi:helix-turn-helix transcriptional regulator [Candidatus Bathyarchaeota archaeon]|nr:MAG: helix-turn-helix transcriptional regulator [Candidatus Bathyarchaeota archaeon]